jgi:sugar phosphate isomerase/epimerase
MNMVLNYFHRKFFMMKRRTFIALSTSGAAGLTFISPAVFSDNPDKPEVRLGGPVFGKYNDPGEWIQLLRKSGYRAAYCPVNPGCDANLIQEYRKTAENNDLIIAEVGAWSNPLSPDENTSKQAMSKCVDALSLAEQIQARCCVNISGSRNPRQWAGPHPDNLTPATFDLIVETTRKIIDAVKPTKTWFTLEAMPWAYPDSADSYLRLIKAIDRKRFAVHLDPVNMVTSPQLLYRNGEMIREIFRKLGPFIKSCHAKDVTIKEDSALPQLEEVRPGLGILDYKILLGELSKFPDVPLMMEHLDTNEEYGKAAVYIRSMGNAMGIKM